MQLNGRSKQFTHFLCLVTLITSLIAFGDEHCQAKTELKPSASSTRSNRLDNSSRSISSTRSISATQSNGATESPNSPTVEPVWVNVGLNSLLKNPNQISLKVKLARFFFETSNSQRVVLMLNNEKARLKAEQLYWLGVSQKKLNNKIVAEQTFLFSLSQNPNHAPTYFELGKLYLEDKKIDLAIENLKLSYSKDPKFRAAYETLLGHYKGDPLRKYEARLLVADMIAQFGPQDSYVTDMCYYFYDGGFVEQAKDICSKGIKKFDQRADNYVYLGLTYKNTGEAEQAKKYLRKAGQRFPASELAQWAAGSYDYESQNFAGAEKYFKRALASDPHSARAHLGLAQTLFKMQRYPDALKHFSEHCVLLKMISEEFRLATGTLMQMGSPFHSSYVGEMSNCSAKGKSQN